MDRRVPLQDTGALLPDRAAIRTSFKLPLRRGRCSGLRTGQGERAMTEWAFTYLAPGCPHRLQGIALTARTMTDCWFFTISADFRIELVSLDSVFPCEEPKIP